MMHAAKLRASVEAPAFIVFYDDMESALTERSAQEKKHAGNPDVEVCTLSASSLADAIVTHGRYFRNTIKFEERTP